MSRPLPRFTDQTITHDPLETLLAQREAERERTRAAITTSGYATPDPADLRGIPCIARGVGGTSPHTNPLTEAIRNDHRLRSIR